MVRQERCHDFIRVDSSKCSELRSYVHSMTDFFLVEPFCLPKIICAIAKIPFAGWSWTHSNETATRIPKPWSQEPASCFAHVETKRNQKATRVEQVLSCWIERPRKLLGFSKWGSCILRRAAGLGEEVRIFCADCAQAICTCYKSAKWVTIRVSNH